MPPFAPRLALAASRGFADLDDGWPLLHEALVAVGFDPQVAVWDDPTVDWGSFDMVAVNYVWGYVTRHREFLDWTARVATETRLVNPRPVVEWNSQKTYLADLAADGIPIVPTSWVPPGAGWTPPSDDYVIKPSVASGSLGAARYLRTRIETAEEHVRRLHREGQTVMVQPYQPAIDAHGEVALIYFDHRYSHAVSKQALLEPDVGEIDRLWERHVITPAEATDHQRSLAETTLEAVTLRVGPTAYARVDVIDDLDGHPMVLEVELIEPAFYFTYGVDAPERVAAVLRRWAE
jgi:glutathione synthase/RimK-type ligase-like ATP-grasp enzyme